VFLETRHQEHIDRCNELLQQLRTAMLIPYIKEHKEWSLNAFGDRPTYLSVCSHIEKELKEIHQNPHDLEEWIDVMILAIDGAWRAGYTAEDIVTMLTIKQQKNKGRRWVIPENPNDPIEHDRDAE